MSKVKILRRWLLLAVLAAWARSCPETFLACVPMLFMPPLFRNCTYCSPFPGSSYQVVWTGLANGTCSNCSRWNITAVLTSYDINNYPCCYYDTPSNTDACGAGNTLFTMHAANSALAFPHAHYYLATIRSNCLGFGDTTGLYAYSGELGDGIPANTYDCTQTVNSGWTFTSNDGGCTTGAAGLTVTAL